MSIYVYDKVAGKVVEKKPRDELLFDLLPSLNDELFRQYQDTLEHCRHLMLGYPVEPTK
jgi:hypothetical protein